MDLVSRQSKLFVLGYKFDKYFGNNNNTKTNESSAHILTIISSYVNSKASRVLATMYNMEEPKLNQLHASKATLQYGFHRGIREFGDEG